MVSLHNPAARRALAQKGVNMAKRGARGKPTGSRRRRRRGGVLAVALLASSTAAFSIFELERAVVRQEVDLSRDDEANLEPRLRAFAGQGANGLAVVVES